MQQQLTSIQLLRAWTVPHHLVGICATHGPWNNIEWFCSVHRRLTCVLFSGCYTHQPKVLPSQHKLFVVSQISLQFSLLSQFRNECVRQIFIKHFGGHPPWVWSCHTEARGYVVCDGFRYSTFVCIHNTWSHHSAICSCGKQYRNLFLVSCWLCVYNFAAQCQNSASLRIKLKTVSSALYCLVSFKIYSHLFSAKNFCASAKWRISNSCVTTVRKDELSCRCKLVY